MNKPCHVCGAKDHEPYCSVAPNQRARIASLEAENARLRRALEAASGYLLNAKIDLETGAPKRTAIQTIDGGLKVVRAALAALTPASDGEG